MTTANKIKMLENQYASLTAKAPLHVKAAIIAKIRELEAK